MNNDNEPGANRSAGSDSEPLNSADWKVTITKFTNELTTDTVVKPSVSNLSVPNRGSD